MSQKHAWADADWRRLWAQVCDADDTPARAVDLAERAAEDVRQRLPYMGAVPAMAWSGGKDSVALAEVVRRAGAPMPAVYVNTALEYPAFERFVRTHKPFGCETVTRPWDLDWLHAHPEMLFPDDSRIGARWGNGVQRWGERKYARAHGVDVLLLGRRRVDGNYVANARSSWPDEYQDGKGLRWWSPLADWTHEDLLTVIRGLGLPMAPTYTWRDGFKLGTGPWPKRRRHGESMHDAWSYVWRIDAGIVLDAAKLFASAERFLEVRDDRTDAQ